MMRKGFSTTFIRPIPLQRSIKQQPIQLNFWGTRTVLALLAIVQLLAGMGCDATPSKKPSVITNSSANSIAVTVRIDFNGRKENIEKVITVPSPATVYSALIAAMPNGTESSGEGETLFIKSIGEVANEGAGKDNWTYRVNQKLGKTSCGISPLTDQDKVEWTLGKYDPAE